MGSRTSDRRAELLARAAANLPASSKVFWASLRDSVVAHGLGGIGKFEGYFRLLRRYVLPIAVSHAMLATTFYYWVYGRDLIAELIHKFAT